MPIEIRELHIRITVNAESKGSSGADGRVSGSSNAASGQMATDHEAIVAECVEQVLAVLKTREER